MGGGIAGGQVELFNLLALRAAAAPGDAARLGVLCPETPQKPPGFTTISVDFQPYQTGTHQRIPQAIPWRRPCQKREALEIIRSTSGAVSLLAKANNRSVSVHDLGTPEPPAAPRSAPAAVHALTIRCGRRMRCETCDARSGDG